MGSPLVMTVATSASTGASPSHRCDVVQSLLFERAVSLVWRQLKLAAPAVGQGLPFFWFGVCFNCTTLAATRTCESAHMTVWRVFHACHALLNAGAQG